MKEVVFVFPPSVASVTVYSAFTNHEWNISFEREICHLCPLKVEYHANENPLKHSEKIAYVGQRLMYPIIKKQKYLTMLVLKKKRHYVFRLFH